MASLSFADKWTKKGDVPIEILQSSASVYNNEIYVFGGPHGGQTTAYKYNPSTDKWKKLADMPHARQGSSSVEVNGKIYVFGTFMGDSPVDIYDPTTDTWETKSNMPNGRGLSGTIAIGDKIYIIGGWVVNGNKDFSDIDVYDIKTDTWEKKKPAPTPIESFGVCAINEKIYVIGGFITQPFPQILFSTDTNNVWEYDTNKETWTQKANMPTVRESVSVSIINGKIYVLGGLNTNIGMGGLSTFDVYDPSSDTWANTQNMPDASMSHVAGVINNRIYRIGGMGFFQQVDTIHKYLYEYEPFIQPTTSVSPKESLIGTWSKIRTGN